MVNESELATINELYKTTNQDERAILIEFLEYDVPEEERDIGRKFASVFDQVVVDRSLEVDKTNSVVTYAMTHEGHKFEFTVTFTFVLNK